MRIPTIRSIKAIEHHYCTGEEPVLVIGSDMKAYVCKYMRSSASAYKLTCELIGTQMAKTWQLYTPDAAFVYIRPEHWAGQLMSHNISAPSLGSKRIEGVVDITPSTIMEVEQTDSIFRQLLKIALFDFWIANEDRNANNANLLYDVRQGRLISIDYGCALNTATFEYPLSQLTSTDTILWSDLFDHIVKNVNHATIEKAIMELEKSYKLSLKRCDGVSSIIIEDLPKEWNVSPCIVTDKLQQLFSRKWVADVWENFMECLKENIRK